MPEPLAGIYLLHFEPAYLHAGHYMGWTDDLERRLLEHRSGGSKASPLVRAAIASGSSVSLVSFSPGASRVEERRRKRGGHVPTRWCPVCRSRSLLLHARAARLSDPRQVLGKAARPLLSASDPGSIPGRLLIPSVANRRDDHTRRRDPRQ